MGFGQFLQQQGLSPDVTARLQTIYDTPDGEAPPTDDAGNAVAPGASSPIPTPGYVSARGAPGMIDMHAKPAGEVHVPMAPGVSTSEAPKGEAARAAAEEWGGKEAGDIAAAGAPGEAGDEGGVRAGLAAPAGHYVPGGWQPSSRGEQRKLGINPEHLEEGRYFRDVAAGHGMLAADKHLEAAQMQGEADAAYAAAHQAAAQQALDEQRRIDNERKKYIADEHAKLNNLTVAAQKQVDPEAAKGSSGAQLMAALGIALGQYGASITGGPNAALQIVQSNIDRNIKAQEANIANAGKSLDAERSLYHQNLEAFGDRDRAVAATKIQMLDQAKAIADQQYAKAKGSINEADYHATIQGLNEAKAQAADQFTARTEDQVTTEGHEAYRPGGMVGGGGGKPLENLVTLSDGTSVQMPNEKQQDKAIEKIQVVDKLQRLNNEALQVRTRIAKLDPIVDHTEYSSAHKTLEDLEERKAGLLSTEAGQGVLRDSEYARAVNKQGFYTQGVGFFKGNPVAASERESADANLRRQIQRGDEDQRAFVKAAGGHIVKRGYTHDASGNVTPAAKYTGQDLKPAEQLAPRGSVPMKKGTHIPTADEPLEETTPRGEDLGVTPSAPSSGGKKKVAGKETHVHGGKRR